MHICSKYIWGKSRKRICNSFPSKKSFTYLLLLHFLIYSCYFVYIYIYIYSIVTYDNHIPDVDNLLLYVYKCMCSSFCSFLEGKQDIFPYSKFASEYPSLRDLVDDSNGSKFHYPFDLHTLKGPGRIVSLSAKELLM